MKWSAHRQPPRSLTGANNYNHKETSDEQREKDSFVIRMKVRDEHGNVVG